jgi:succinyl-CoA synthetase beta subunit
MSIDDNALFRHPSLKEMEDVSQLPQEERLARKSELAYIALDGNIGCMVNGAGLAMATMDMILLYGGKPANFLDVGGGATVEKITEGFKLLLNDHKVKAILINIFGGIMDCALIADGVIEAIQETGLNVPLVVRMEGTNVEAGRKKLQASQLPIVSTNSLKEAAEMSVKSVGV